MIDKILTPTTLWEDFKEDLPLKPTKISTISLVNAEYGYLYFSGRQTEKGRVRIFGMYYKNFNAKKSILIIPDISMKIDENLVMYFGKLGYNVLCVDLCGEQDSVTNFTKYPDDIPYANYKNCCENLLACKDTAKETCWYEWVCVLRYSIKYILEELSDEELYCLGIKNGANVLWELAGSTKNISKCVFLYGAGYLSYKNILKYSTENLTMDDEKYKFLAGIDAQAYSKNVNSNVLYITSTNSSEFSVDRCADTLSMVDSSIVLTNYVTSSENFLDKESLQNIELFFNDNFKTKKNIIKNPELKIDVEENILRATVETYNQRTKNIEVYYSFDDIVPEKRVYYKMQKNSNNEFFAKLYKNVNLILAFCKIELESNYTITSKIVSKNIEFTSLTKYPPILYQKDRVDSQFLLEDEDSSIFNFKDTNITKQGPNDICALYFKNSKIINYSIKNYRDRLFENSIITFDIYVPNNTDIVFGLTLSNDSTYEKLISLSGGECWQNIKIQLDNIKNEYKFSIKDYNLVEAFYIKCNGIFMVNNILIL